MASSSLQASNNPSWTVKQHKQFERALAVYDQDTPNRWHKIAGAVGRSVEEVRQQYDRLVEDVSRIESGSVSFPYGRTAANAGVRGGVGMMEEEQRRFRNMRI